MIKIFRYELRRLLWNKVFAGILVVSFFFSILLQGGTYMQTSMQIPAAAADVMQGIILLFILGSEFFTQYKIIHEKKEVA